MGNTSSRRFRGGGLLLALVVVGSLLRPDVTQAATSPKFVQRKNVRVTSGSTDIIAIGWNDTTAVLTSVTDGAGNVYQPAIATYRGNGLSQAVYYAANIGSTAAGGNPVTVRFDRAAVFVDLRITEYAGVSHTAPFDAGRSATGNGTAADSGALTAAGPSELLFAAGITSAVFTGPGSGFSSRVITAPDGDIVEDAVTASAGSYHATAPLTSGTWILPLAAFRGAGAGP